MHANVKIKSRAGFESVQAKSCRYGIITSKRRRHHTWAKTHHPNDALLSQAKPQKKDQWTGWCRPLESAPFTPASQCRLAYTIRTSAGAFAPWRLECPSLRTLNYFSGFVSMIIIIRTKTRRWGVRQDGASGNQVVASCERVRRTSPATPRACA